MNRLDLILGEDDARSTVNILEVDVRHKPGGLIPRNLQCLRLRLGTDRLILGEVVKEWIVGARAHLPDKLGDQGTRQPLREGKPQFIARVNDAVDKDPILAEAITRGNCGKCFALHDNITVYISTWRSMCHKSDEDANRVRKIAKTSKRASLIFRITNRGLRHSTIGLYIEIKWSRGMKKLIGIALITLTLSSCGTAQGVMNGVGEVLTGMAVDARSVGSVFN